MKAATVTGTHVRSRLWHGSAVLLLGWSGLAGAVTYLDDIGYTALVADGPLADGAGVRIDQVEASTAADPQNPVYRADPANAAFSGVNFIDQTAGPSPLFSGHATGVALRFAGNDAMTPGVATVDSYEANDWIGAVLYGDEVGSLRPVVGTGVLANHSWVGNTETVAQAADLLQRLDWLVLTDGFVQVVAAQSTTRTLLAPAYNVLAVAANTVPVNGLSPAIDPFYVAGRPLPQVSVPLPTISAAVSVVTSAAALLMATATDASPPPELLKVLLMAGADSRTRNVSGANLLAYTASTTNGLDPRYGAGQLNIRNSHQLLLGGEHHSAEDGGVPAAPDGYDSDDAFGGAAGSNGIANYPLSSLVRGGQLAVSLSWLARLVDDIGPFVPARTLYNLDLQLIETTAGGELVSASSSSAIDNTENLRLVLSPGHQYTIRVINAHGADFNWPYAIAWHLDLDGDGDTLPDRHETTVCPHADDADSDDDGLADGAEDVDDDGVLDATETSPCAADSDGDGVQDGTERGVTTGVADPDGAGPLLGTDATRFQPDADPTTTTAPTIPDSDGDGYVDGLEDSNANGRLDAGESDPGSATSVPQHSVTVPLPPWSLWLLAVGLAGLAQLMRNTSLPICSDSSMRRCATTASSNG